VDAQSRFVMVSTSSPQALLAEQLQLRCEAAQPLRVCDDDERWAVTWRTLTREAKEALRLL